MGTSTAIQWTATYNADGTITPGHTWNPWQGCTKVSQGCKFCYMYDEKKRYGQDPMTVVRSKDPTFNAPLKWHDAARVFTCSWSDFFHEAADEWRDAAWDIIRRTPHLTYQVLTKRPERIADHLPADWGATGYPNVWLGTSAEDNQSLITRSPALLQIPAAVHFLSAEPLLAPLPSLKDYLFRKQRRVVDKNHPFTPVNAPHAYPTGVGDTMFRYPDTAVFRVLDGYDWVIVGGESGAHARTMELEWASAIVEQCQKAGVAVFVKQTGNVLAKRLRLAHNKGGDIEEWPDVLRVREFPKVEAA